MTATIRSRIPPTNIAIPLCHRRPDRLRPTKKAATAASTTATTPIAQKIAGTPPCCDVGEDPLGVRPAGVDVDTSVAGKAGADVGNSGASVAGTAVGAG